MWICLNNAFLSIVKKDCAKDELMVRARRRGDIERVFGKNHVMVIEGKKGDYQFRARVHRERVMSAIAREIGNIRYPNFKDTVKDKRLAGAYMSFWHEMFILQETL